MIIIIYYAHNYMWLLWSIMPIMLLLDGTTIGKNQRLVVLCL
jgi:hypothetical protein